MTFMHEAGKHLMLHTLEIIIVELVDSISKDGPDIHIHAYAIHHNKPNNSEGINF